MFNLKKSCISDRATDATMDKTRHRASVTFAEGS